MGRKEVVCGPQVGSPAPAPSATLASDVVATEEVSVARSVPTQKRALYCLLELLFLFVLSAVLFFLSLVIWTS